MICIPDASNMDAVYIGRSYNMFKEVKYAAGEYGFRHLSVGVTIGPQATKDEIFFHKS